MLPTTTSFTISTQSLSRGVSMLEWIALSIVYPLLLGPCGTSGVVNIESNIRINATGNPEGIGRIVDDLVGRLYRYAILESLTESLRLTQHSTRHTCSAGYFVRTSDVVGSNPCAPIKVCVCLLRCRCLPMQATDPSFAAMGCP